MYSHGEGYGKWHEVGGYGVRHGYGTHHGYGSDVELGFTMHLNEGSLFLYLGQCIKSRGSKKKMESTVF